MNQDKKLPKPIYVYTLSDPRTGAVRYVGVSDNPKRRMNEHLRESRKDKHHRANWINSLVRNELKPIMNIIDETDNENWVQCEIRWIAHYRSMGCNLVNSTDGGDGLRGYSYTEETCRKRSELMRGENHPMYGKPVSIEQRRKLSESCPHKKSVYQYDKFGHFIRQWDSIMDASRTLSIQKSDITKCCTHTVSHKTAGGFIWRYADDPLLGEYPVQLKLDFE